MSTIHNGADANRRRMPNDQIEGGFRREVRDLLDFDIFTRDEQIFARIRKHRADRVALLMALKDLLEVIATDELVPESVSYMREARAAVKKAEAK